MGGFHLYEAKKKRQVKSLSHSGWWLKKLTSGPGYNC